MDVDYLLVCSIIWRETSDPIVGRELINGLNSQDASIRQIAREILVGCGESSMKLLESAFAVGRITPESAGDCMAELFRSQLKEELTNWEQPSN